MLVVIFFFVISWLILVKFFGVVLWLFIIVVFFLWNFGLENCNLFLNRLINIIVLLWWIKFMVLFIVCWLFVVLIIFCVSELLNCVCSCVLKFLVDGFSKGNFRCVVICLWCVGLVFVIIICVLLVLVIVVVFRLIGFVLIISICLLGVMVVWCIVWVLIVKGLINVVVCGLILFVGKMFVIGMFKYLLKLLFWCMLMIEIFL